MLPILRFISRQSSRRGAQCELPNRSRCLTAKASAAPVASSSPDASTPPTTPKAILSPPPEPAAPTPPTAPAAVAAQQAPPVAPDTASAVLRKIIVAEIKLETQHFGTSTAIKKFIQGGPFKFEETDGDVNMALVREEADKTLRLHWQLSGPYDPSLHEKGGGEMKTMPGGTKFSVTIENTKTGAGVTFSCQTQAGDDHRFVVGNIAVFISKEEKESPSAYKGPDFEDLDVNMQQACADYLTEQGVHAAVCDFIDASAFDKEQREYMRWLSHMKNFLE